MVLALDITLFIWGIVLLGVSGCLFYFGKKYFNAGKNYEKAQKLMLVEAEQRLKLQFNKIATMKPDELTVYLSGIFGRYLELNGELGTNKDNLVLERLFTDTQADMLNYLGDDTIHAIEYYYGEGYIEKWSNLAYLILEKRRKLGGIVDGSVGYESVESMLHQDMMFGKKNDKTGP